MEFSEQSQGLIRLSVFIGIFALMAMLEILLPRKQRTMPKVNRWVTNWSLVVIDSVALQFLVPVLAVGVALIATEKGWGLLSVLMLPSWLQIIVAVVLLDMLIYAQHVVTHKIPILWRFHRVHHVDRDIDVTTGARFHPVEIILSMLFKLLCIIALGAPAIAVFLFEVILNASAMFNHSNVKLPLSVDRVVRLFVVTPDMHRVHHSIIQKETDSNYGFFLSIWDRLFRTYIDQPREGHNDMTIGLADYQDDKPASLLWCLLFPFKSNKPS